MRIKHTFFYHGNTFYCGDLTLEDYLLINIDLEYGLEKIFTEYNEKIPQLNPRQSKEFMRIMLGQENEKKNEDLMDKLTETQKKILIYKKNKKPKEKDIQKEIDEMLEDFNLIEGQVMHYLHQSLSEIRKWPYQYFMRQYADIPYITGQKEYEKNRNSTDPDKKGFKKEFGNVYNK